MVFLLRKPLLWNQWCCSVTVKLTLVLLMEKHYPKQPGMQGAREGRGKEGGEREKDEGGREGEGGRERRRKGRGGGEQKKEGGRDQGGRAGERRGDTLIFS